MSTNNIPFSPIITNNDKIDGIDKQKGQLLFNIDNHNIYLDESNDKRINIAPTDYAWVTNYKEAGDTDDTNAFKRALSNNRLVYVPEGEYTLSDTIEIKGNCELQLSQGTVLNFKQVNAHCIILHRLARLTGNHATINVPYEFTGHVIHGSIEKDAQLITDYTAAVLGASATEQELDEAWKDNMNNVTPPFTGAWDPQWKTARYITDINICKKTSTLSLQAYLANSAKWNECIQKTLEEYIKTKVSNYDSLGPAEQEDLQLQYTKEYTDVYCPQLRRNFSNYTDRHSSIAGDTNGVAVYMECKPMFDPSSYERDASGNRTNILKAKPTWASLDQMWGLNFSGLHIAGAFDRGVWFKNISVTYQYRDTDGSIKTGTYDPWNHDARVQGITQGCRVSAEIDTCNNVHLLLTIQPSSSLSDKPAPSNYKLYADQGILLINSHNIDLGQSCVWDWNEWTAKTGEENQHIAMFGNCSGLTMYDYSLVSSKGFWDTIYYDNPASMFNSTIIGAKGPLPIDPKYAFYKNFRGAGWDYQRFNLTWRDFHNTQRRDVPVAMQNGWTYPNSLYKIGHFVMGGVPEGDPDGKSMADYLGDQVLTIEENDYQGLAGWSNFVFNANSDTADKANSFKGTLTHYWNPLSSNCEKRAPIYFYTVEKGDSEHPQNTRVPIYVENPDTGAYDILDHYKYPYTVTLYRFVPDRRDIMPSYYQKVHMLNGRRFIFDFNFIGYYDDNNKWYEYDKVKSAQTYTTKFKDPVALTSKVFPFTKIEPIIDDAQPQVAGQYNVKDGGATVCIQSAMHDKFGTQINQPIVHTLAFQDDIKNMVINKDQRVAGSDLIKTNKLKVIQGVYVDEYGDHDKESKTPEKIYQTGNGTYSDPYCKKLCLQDSEASQMNIIIGSGYNTNFELTNSSQSFNDAGEVFFPNASGKWGTGFNNSRYSPSTNDLTVDKHLRLHIKGIDFEKSRMGEGESKDVWQSHAYGRLYVIYTGEDKLLFNSNLISLTAEEAATTKEKYPLYDSSGNRITENETNHLLYARESSIIKARPLYNANKKRLKANSQLLYGKESGFTDDPNEGIAVYDSTGVQYKTKNGQLAYFKGFVTDADMGYSITLDGTSTPFKDAKNNALYLNLHEGTTVDALTESVMYNAQGVQYSDSNGFLYFIPLNKYFEYTNGSLYGTCNAPGTIAYDRKDKKIFTGPIEGTFESTGHVAYQWDPATKTMVFDIEPPYSCPIASAPKQSFSFIIAGPLAEGYTKDQVSVETLIDLETYIKNIAGTGGGSSSNLTYAWEETEGF